MSLLQVQQESLSLNFKQIEDREFPALIVRIDSPGGTVGDSQEIYSAIKRLKDKGCKVIASFGNISASGGVYIGVASDKIVANPGTITGSIGVIIWEIIYLNY